MHLLKPQWVAAVDDYVVGIAPQGVAMTASGQRYGFEVSSGDLIWQHALSIPASGVLAWAEQPATARMWAGGYDGSGGWFQGFEASSTTPTHTLPNPVEHLAWDAKGKSLAAAGGKQLWLGGATGGQNTVSPEVINGLSWNPIGGLLATAHRDGLRLWRKIDGKIDRHWSWSSPLISASFSPDGRYVAAGTQDKAVHFWRLRDGLDSQMSGYDRKPKALLWSSDSRWLLTSGDAALVAWNFSGRGPEGTHPKQFYGHVSSPNVLLLDKQWLISGGDDGLLCLWPQSSLQGDGSLFEVSALAKINQPITALARVPNLPLLLVGTQQGQVLGFWLDF
jgi:WD40 repeat protein